MRIIFILPILLLSTYLFSQPCNLSDASGCDCKDGTNECDLLPNLKLSYDLLVDPNENFEYPGRYEVSVSTPNVGHGPLRVLATNYFLCGQDTIYNASGLSSCPDGSVPRQLVKQRIYQKKASGSMDYYDRWAGSMTYHQTHGHMHFDDWGVYTLRIEQPGVSPLNWPIIGDGAKLGFCIMDFGSCQYYNGQCRDDNDNILTTNSPNYGLGGGQYSCGLTNQGISAGWTDIYHYYLDGMYIEIPPGTCNGDYKIVVEVDPHNVLVEEDDTDNLMVADVTLTQQSSSIAPTITSNTSNQICAGESTELNVPLIGSDYLWSNGSTTYSITVTNPGNYTCTITTVCGPAISNAFTLSVLDATDPVVAPANICENTNTTLTVNNPGTGTYSWFSSLTGSSPIATGTSYQTPLLGSSTSFYVEHMKEVVGPQHSGGAFEWHGTSSYSSGTTNGQLFFNVNSEFLLKSVKVYTDTEAMRIIELQDANGNVLLTKNAIVPVGESRVNLNFSIPPGNNYILTTNENMNINEHGYASPRLQRTNGTTAYPYDVMGVVSIHDSNFGPGYYYYFYDWEIQEPSTSCVSARTEAAVNVSVLEDATFTYPQATYCTQLDAPVPDFIAAAGGIFTATNGLVIDPTTGIIDISSAVPATIYTVSYSFTSSCPSSHDADITFEVCSGQEELNNLSEFTIQPNPNSGNFSLAYKVDGTYETEISIYDLSGRIIYQETTGVVSGNFVQAIQLDQATSGMYLIQIKAGDQFIHKKMILSK